MNLHTRIGLGACYLFLATPVARSALEAAMSTHMLLQIPLLAAAGVLLARLLPTRRRDALLAACGGALPLVVLALFASSYWMLPRALDAALGDPLTEAAKFVSLPLLVGLPLALAWRRLTAIGRGFVWTNFISMLAVLGWLYIAAPVRVCNNYLVDEQGSTGWLMVKLALLLFAGWLGTLFVGGKPTRRDAHGFVTPPRIMKSCTFDAPQAGKWARPSHPPIANVACDLPLAGRLLNGSLRSTIDKRADQGISR